MKYFVFLLLILIGNILYPIVIIEGKVNKKNIYKWQNIEYSLTFTGDAGSFKAEGLNENAISDFEVVNKRVESETTAKDGQNQSVISTYKILYTLKPISKGNLKIPELEARYYEIRNGNNLIPNLIPHEEPLKEYRIRVFGNLFLIIAILEWLIIIFIAFSIFKFAKSQYLLKKDNKTKILKNKTEKI